MVPFGFWWPHQESNLDLKFRKLLFYPLNYEAVEENKITNKLKCMHHQSDIIIALNLLKHKKSPSESEGDFILFITSFIVSLNGLLYR